MQYDFCGWDIKKALSLLRESNPTLIDCIRSTHTLISVHDFQPSALALCSAHLSFRTVVYQLLAYSQKHYTSYLVGIAPSLIVFKKYFYVIHPLLTMRCLRANRTLPPLDFRRLVAVTPALDDAIRAHMITLLDLKLSQKLACATASHLTAPLNTWIESELTDAAAFIAKMPTHAALRVPFEPFDQLLRRMLFGDALHPE